MSLTSSVDLTSRFQLSGFVCSIALATFVGLFFSEVRPPYFAAISFSGRWMFWSICFAVFFLALTFAPKPLGLHRVNAFLLLLAALLILVTGSKIAPGFHHGATAVVLYTIITLGGPLLALLVAVAWHAVVGLSESRSAGSPSGQEPPTNPQGWWGNRRWP